MINVLWNLKFKNSLNILIYNYKALFQSGPKFRKIVIL